MGDFLNDDALIATRALNKVRDDVLDPTMGHDHVGGHGAALPLEAIWNYRSAFLGNLPTVVFGATFGDGVAAIPSGSQVDVPWMPALAITAWAINAKEAGTISIDVRSAGGLMQGLMGTLTTITASAVPGLAAAASKYSTNLTGWTVTHPIGTAFRFITTTTTTITQLSIVLIAVRTL